MERSIFYLTIQIKLQLQYGQTGHRNLYLRLEIGLVISPTLSLKPSRRVFQIVPSIRHAHLVHLTHYKARLTEKNECSPTTCFKEHATTAIQKVGITRAKRHRHSSELAREFDPPSEYSDTHRTPKQKTWSTHRRRYVFANSLNAGGDVDDAMAAISAPLFDLPTTRIGTAGGFLRFGGGGGDRR